MTLAPSPLSGGWLLAPVVAVGSLAAPVVAAGVGLLPVPVVGAAVGFVVVGDVGSGLPPQAERVSANKSEYKIGR